ncbi:hypothetical protein [Acinetobacter pollinis]|uniref:hypothetical protein n=1 Tax=Acinetobacter pollinis TaxID=2605270 RepID=UPI0018A313E8|nr:hypothetical protein [Acinetobacter pollinis]MBF7690657.1 hypothetical protein [Acinetobacter pollinis]MBF7698619.1 hypothetical protein [Acinetobacter pollinis]
MKKEIKESIDNIFWKTIWMIIVFAFLNFLFLYLFKNCTIVKDTLSNTVSFSSAAATIAAAIIAAHLFNDWKEQHNKQIFSNHAAAIAALLCNERRILDGVNFRLLASEQYSVIDFLKSINNVSNILDSNIPQYMLFIKLDKNNDLYEKILEYQQCLTSIAWAYHDNINDDPKNHRAKITRIRNLNEEIIEVLKSYIFIK